MKNEVVNAALQRADEPGELLGYWTSRYGKAIPKPIKHGIEDAVRRPWDVYALLKYDTAGKGYRFADILDLAHPRPTADRPGQGDLFTYALDRRHHPDTATVPPSARILAANAALRREVTDNPKALLNTDALRAAGMTWENALSLAGSRSATARTPSTLFAPRTGVTTGSWWCRTGRP